jgi:adenylate cyclase
MGVSDSAGRRQRLLDRLCEQPMIEKYRRRIPFGQHVWEVDEFLGANRAWWWPRSNWRRGRAFDKPDWIGAEVTHERRYFNSSLVKSPFKDWTS